MLTDPRLEVKRSRGVPEREPCSPALSKSPSWGGECALLMSGGTCPRGPHLPGNTKPGRWHGPRCKPEPRGKKLGEASLVLLSPLRAQHINVYL